MRFFVLRNPLIFGWIFIQNLSLGLTALKFRRLMTSVWISMDLILRIRIKSPGKI